MRFTFVLSFALAFTLQSYAWDLSVGTGFFAEQSPYSDVGWKYTPMPVIQFDSEYVFFDVQTAGFYLYKGDHSALLLLADYEPMAYDPDDANKAAMKAIDKRRPTLFGGLRYTLWGRYGIVRLEGTGDLLGRTDGFRAKASYGLHFSPAGIDILPEIGVLWHSDEFNDYYFGVSNAESLASGFDAYDGSYSFTPYLGLSAQYAFFNRVKLLLSASYKLTPDKVTDSPIVKKKQVLNVLAGISYIF